MHLHEWHMSLMVGFIGGWCTRMAYTWLRQKLLMS